MARFKGRKIDNATKKRGRDALNRSFNTSYPEEGLNNPITEEDLAIKVHNFANMFINKRKSDPSKYLLFSVNAEGNTLVINLRISNHYSNSSFTLMKANEKITVDKRYSLYFKIGGVDDIVSPEDNISDTKDGAQNVLYEIDGAHLYNMEDVNLLKNAVQELLMKGTFQLPFKKSTAIVPYGFWGKVNEQVRHTIRRIIKENKQYNTMNNKNTIRLTESQLHFVIKSCINEVLSEYKNKDTKYYNDRLDYYKGQGLDYEDEWGDNVAKTNASADAASNGYLKHEKRHPFKPYNPMDRARKEYNRMLQNNWDATNNNIITIHKHGDDDSEWDEDYMEKENPINYKPSDRAMQHYLKKHDYTIDGKHMRDIV